MTGRFEMHRRRLLHTIATIAVGALLSACGSAPPTRWLSLPLPGGGVAASTASSLPASTSSAAVTAPAAPLTNPPLLVVRRVGVPEYLQTNKVRFREGGSVLGEWPGVLWAERLEVGMTDHLVTRLRAALPQWTVCDRICPPGVPQATLGVDLTPLDYVRGDRVLKAGARWELTLRRLPDRAPPRTVGGAHDYALPVDQDAAEAQATAMGHLLDLLGQDIADSVRAIPLASDVPPITGPARPNNGRP